jgi:predicted nucleic acid-binding protein
VIVLDASAAIEWLLQTSKAADVEQRLFWGTTTARTWHAPDLIDIEVAQALRTQVEAGVISAVRGREALQDLMDLPLIRYSQDFLLPRIWELREHLTLYDAAYVALAEVLDAPLITCDGTLADVPGHGAHVTVV